MSLRDSDSPLAGLALNHQKNWNDGGHCALGHLGIGNLHYEFLDGTRIDVAGTSFASAQDRLWSSIGGGAHGWANGRYAVFDEVSYSASLEDAAAKATRALTASAPSALTVNVLIYRRQAVGESYRLPCWIRQRPFFLVRLSDPLQNGI